jgi:hypothetical protein
MIWGKQMFARSCGQSRQHDHSWGRHAMRAGQPTGNRAFDDYKAEALRRLEDEQEAFEAFLQRLRTSKDKSEFDSFMDERARSTAAEDASETKPETGPRPATTERLTAGSRPARVPRGRVFVCPHSVLGGSGFAC